jgi:nucleoside-diphosphate-sugar epimerase
MHLDLPSGSVFFFADKQPYQWTEFEEGVRKSMNFRRMRKLTIPARLVTVLAWSGQIYGKLTGKPVMINRLRQAEFSQRHWVCDTSRLRQTLDFKSKWNLLDGLKATITWYGREGWL